MRVDYLRERNALRLTLGPSPPAAATVRSVGAMLDVGEAGSLLGVEFPVGDDSALAGPWPNPEAVANASSDGPTSETFYVPLGCTAGAHVRSVPAVVEVMSDANGTPVAVEIPRRGDGYEISYPSGNQ